MTQMLNATYVFFVFSINKTSFFFYQYLWKEICDEILTEANQEYATPKLITKLMYAFRDIQVWFLVSDFYSIWNFLQDYQSMIELTERCEKYEIIAKKN
jgi:hypothetical protein